MSGTHFLRARLSQHFSLHQQLADRHPSTMVRIRHTLFDLGGILYDDSAWRRWLFHLVAHVGLHTQYTSFFRVWDCEFQPDVWHGRCSFWSALKRFLNAAGVSRGQAQEIEAACRARFRQFERDIRPFPSVAQTLDQILTAGCSVTVISQAPLSTNQISVRLGELGLSRQITQVGCAGTDNGRDVFQRFVRRHRVPQEVVYVGRDAAPLAAARRCKMQTVAFNYDADAEADFYIEQFDQLPQVLNLGTAPLLAAG